MDAPILIDPQTTAFGKWVISIVGTFVVGYTGKELLIWGLELLAKRKRSEEEPVEGGGNYRRRSDEGIARSIEMQERILRSQDLSNINQERQTVIMERLEENQRVLIRIVESQEKSIVDIATRQKNVEFHVGQLFHKSFPAT